MAAASFSCSYLPSQHDDGRIGRRRHLPEPDEISLAYNVLGFQRRVLDALRESLETGKIYIARVQTSVCLLACFQLVAAMNSSPFGDHSGVHARCEPAEILRYLNRLSGSFLDRFDLSVEVPTPGLLHRRVPFS